MIANVPFLMHLASLNPCSFAESVANRLRQRLATVDHEQLRAVAADASMNQIVQQLATRRRVLRRSFVESKDVLSTLGIDAQRHQDDMVREAQPVDQNARQLDLPEAALHPPFHL